MTLGEKIQKLRKQRGLSQEALAEKVTVTRQTISKWELGQSLPDLDFIAQLSDIFNVSSDYLIKDEMTEPDELPYKKRNYRLSGHGRKFCVSDFRQTQEYHSYNVHNRANTPCPPLSPSGWNGMRAGTA